MLATDQVSGIETADFNVVRTIRKLFPTSGMKGEPIGEGRLHAPSKWFGGFRSDDVVMDLFPLSGLLIVHDLLGEAA